jgi:hypothetical protein
MCGGVSSAVQAVPLEQGERCCVLLHVLEQLDEIDTPAAADVLRVCSVLSAEARPEPMRRLMKGYSLRILRQRVK